MFAAVFELLQLRRWLRFDVVIPFMTESRRNDEAGESEEDITNRDQQYDNLQRQGDFSGIPPGVRLRENK